MRSFIVALFCCLLVPSFVEAKPSRSLAHEFRGDRYVGSSIAWGGGMGSDVAEAVRAQRSTKKPVPLPRARPKHRRWRAPGSVAPLTLAGGFTREVRQATTQIIGGRPSGCPSRFCGCGASLYLFGRIIPKLNLAANWLRFPRTHPAPNMVAARRGHVFVLKQHIAGSVWLAYDANSGGRRIRIHPRSIAGYSIVNPHGA